MNEDGLPTSMHQHIWTMEIVWGTIPTLPPLHCSPPLVRDVGSLYGVIGGLSGCVLVLLIVSVVAVVVCLLKCQNSDRKGNNSSSGHIVVNCACSKNQYSTAKDNMEMTRNQVYGAHLTKGTARQEAAADIAMKGKMGHYEVTSESKRKNSQTSQDDIYECI